MSPKPPANTLRKEERISLQREIDLLYKQGQSFKSFPMRVVYLSVETPEPPSVSILTVVSKKNFKRATARNYIKRRIRESYRIRKHKLVATIGLGNRSLLIAFMYIDKAKCTFGIIDDAMTKALATMIRKL
ncbi:MAG: ribonuclease P protein component [Tannerellaceae bacterium]|nr:ribonuclease P protein component [Tannerellaceae bacterium]